MTFATRLSAGALLISALCAACGGRNLTVTRDGGAGSGGSTADATAEADHSIAGSDGSADLASDGRSTDGAMPDHSIAGSDGGADLASDGRGTDGTAPTRLAANGVPIPPPALDPCALLAPQSAGCGASGTCAPLSCDCGGAPLVFAECKANCAVCAGQCVVGISCPSACALGPSALTKAFDCLYAHPSSSKAACKSDADCAGAKCLVPPNAASGECTAGQPRSPCLANSDCQRQTGIGLPLPIESPACVVTADGLGVCGNVGLNGEPCNTDAQCTASSRCVIAPGTFAGVCVSGGENSLCFAQRDCPPSFDCVLSAGASNHTCTSRRSGAACAGDADCASGFFCVDSVCNDGNVRARCKSVSQCHVPFCVNSTCSEGGVGDGCNVDGDCVARLRCSSGTCDAEGPCKVDGDCYAGYFCVDATCSDGASGARCKTSNQCVAGFSCISLSTCSLGRFGDPCGVDGDCQDQGFCGAQGRCSDGSPGTACRRDASGCGAGLHCTNDPTYGLICVGA